MDKKSADFGDTLLGSSEIFVRFFFFFLLGLSYFLGELPHVGQREVTAFVLLFLVFLSPSITGVVKCSVASLSSTLPHPWRK